MVYENKDCIRYNNLQYILRLRHQNSNLAIYPESYLYRPIRTKPIIHFALLQLLLLSNDVAEIPGPDNKVGDLTAFHWNARSVRNKIEHFLLTRQDLQ
jgi:hypothetical protein